MTFSLHISSYTTKSAGPGLISIFCKDKPARNIMIKSCQGLTVCCIYCESRQCILHTPKTQTLIAKVNFKQCTARSMQNKKKESLKFNFSNVLSDPLCYGVPPSLNTQSCNKRPLCSTFTSENVRSPKKSNFIQKKIQKRLKD